MLLMWEDGREAKIDNKIDDKGQQDNESHLFPVAHNKHLTKRNGNDDIQHRPHRAKKV